MIRPVLLVALLGLASCASNGGPAPASLQDGNGDPWDDAFRYGIYDHHYGDDVVVARPDRPDPPPDWLQPHPSRPIAPLPRGDFGRGMGSGRRR